MPKKLNILLSAYACEPNRGSEPGIGWNWAITLNNLGHNVTVITRKNNKNKIDNYIKTDSNLQRINFIYYDLPKYLLRLKKLMGVYCYYELWQIGILKHVKKHLNPNDYDIVQHITFGVFRQPSYLYKFKKPFVFGPLGGGEKMPKSILKEFPIKYRVVEYVRDCLNNFSLKRPALKKCFKNSSLIFARTIETQNIIPNTFKPKTKVKIDIGLYDNEITNEAKVLDIDKTKNILYVGRLTYWKGLDLAIRAFHQYNNKHPNSVFNIIGSGNYREEMEQLANSLNIGEKINFLGQMPQTELLTFYKNATVFLFPSLHDAGPLVTLEALRVGLPIVTLNLGGLGQLLTSTYPTIVNSKDFDKNNTIEALSNFLLELSIDKNFYKNCSEHSIQIAKNNTWQNTVNQVYTIVENDFKTIHN